MSELPLEPERHEDAEALLVLDGRLELEVEQIVVSVGAGELYPVPAGCGARRPPRELGDAGGP
ncbi:cupin domain-containing protein [Kitasatospora sp. NPDC001175]|uniref:cupin domain-containing protein n=1 Tax=Kitasatospora sp. NPDC001175 TaxID=3157103 RepID=UPI003D01B8C0